MLENFTNERGGLGTRNLVHVKMKGLHPDILAGWEPGCQNFRLTRPGTDGIPGPLSTVQPGRLTMNRSLWLTPGYTQAR
jgi:hypothetical protein